MEKNVVRRHWTKEEIAYLRIYLRDTPVDGRSIDYLSSYLGKSHDSIRIKAGRLGLLIRNIGDAESRIIKSWYDGNNPGISLVGLARSLGRNKGTVCAFAARQGWTKRTRPKPTIRGVSQHKWIPAPLSLDSFRNRARKLFDLPSLCERCNEKPPVDRHHVDSNPKNNQRENISFLCRRCHLIIDGRLSRLQVIGRLAKRQPRQKIPPMRCMNCTGLAKPLRKGRCHACNEYWRRHSTERSASTINRHRNSKGRKATNGKA